MQEVITRYGKSEIFNTNQGRQFTCSPFIELLKYHSICQSMDDKVVATTCSPKACGGQSSTSRSVRPRLGWISLNTARPHSSLDGKTPGQVYFNLKLVNGSPLAKNAT